MPSQKKEEKKREKRKEEEPKKKTVFGPVPPCKASDCPIKTPHSQGLYLHEGKSVTGDPIFRRSNPPPTIKRAGTMKEVLLSMDNPFLAKESDGDGGFRHGDAVRGPKGERCTFLEVRG